MGTTVTSRETDAGRATFRLRFADRSTSEPREASVVDVDPFVQTLVEELVWDTPDGTPPLDALLIETPGHVSQIPFTWPQAGAPGGKIHIAPRSVHWPRRPPDPDRERAARIRRGLGLGLVDAVSRAIAVEIEKSPRAAAVAALSDLATTLRDAYDASHGWGLALPGYNGCSDGCVPCVVDWIRAQIEGAS